MDSTTKYFAKSTLPLVIVADIGSVVVKRDLTKFKRLFKMTALLLVMRQSELKGGLLIPTFIGQAILKCFTWQFSLYVLIRQAMFKFKSDILCTPRAIFSIHMFSWFLLGIHAEKVEPGYLRMWAQTLPEYNKGMAQSWLAEFSSEATASEYYQPHQVTKERFRSLPMNMLKSMKFQFPFCVALYIISFVRGIKKSTKAVELFKNAADVLLKSLRTSAVLAVLPYSMCAFPSIYANLLLPLVGKKPKLDDEGNLLVRRNNFLHVTFAALFSTLAFLQEPYGRMKMMVGYMIWRVFEGLGKTYVVKEEEQTKKRLIAAAFTAMTVHLCLPSK